MMKKDGDGAGHTPMNPPTEEHPTLEQANTHPGHTSTPKSGGPPDGMGGDKKREGSH
jgi:hypothetical protein